MQFISFVVASLLGFIVFEMLSNPSKKGYHKLPKIRVKFIEILPNTKIHIRGRVVHFHHWMYLSILFTITVFYNPILIDSVFAKGAMIGGIAQGLTFPDWKIIIKNPSNR